MSFRNDVLWAVPLTRFQVFDHGEIISDNVPARWDLAAGDRLEYEAGCNIAGVAEVVSVQEGSDFPDWDATIADEDPPMIKGSLCRFKKIN